MAETITTEAQNTNTSPALPPKPGVAHLTDVLLSPEGFRKAANQRRGSLYARLLVADASLTADRLGTACWQRKRSGVDEAGKPTFSWQWTSIYSDQWDPLGSEDARAQFSALAVWAQNTSPAIGTEPAGETTRPSRDDAGRVFAAILASRLLAAHGITVPVPAHEESFRIYRKSVGVEANIYSKALRHLGAILFPSDPIAA